MARQWWAERVWTGFRAWPVWLQAIAWLIAWWILVPVLAWRSTIKTALQAGITALCLIAFAGLAAARVIGTGASCPSTPLLGVYHSYRLHVLAACKWYTGTVTGVRHEDDGDFHVDMAPDSGETTFLDQGNYSYQHGSLVTEIMPGQSLPVPWVGERVAIYGTWVYDANHGWNEIHPIWAIKCLDTGKTVSSLPPANPLYQAEGYRNSDSAHDLHLPGHLGCDVLSRGGTLSIGAARLRSKRSLSVCSWNLRTLAKAREPPRVDGRQTSETEKPQVGSRIRISEPLTVWTVLAIRADRSAGLS